MKRIFTFLAASLAVMSCGVSKVGQTAFPSNDQGGKIAIVAHRGFWNCEAAGYSENTIASLTQAQNAGLWGSECDIRVTGDGVVIVNHNPDIEGHVICKTAWADLQGFLLPNGERRPTFDEYLDQVKKCKTTKLIIELKTHPTRELEDELLDKTVKALKKHGLYKPERVLFISFSRHLCDRIAAEHPRFVNQYLTSDKKKDESPSQYAKAGINGVDYEYHLFENHPEWVKEAHDNGMSVNVWTVNKEKRIRNMIDVNVDQITTNEPLLVRELLGDREYKLAK